MHLILLTMLKHPNPDIFIPIIINKLVSQYTFCIYFRNVLQFCTKYSTIILFLLHLLFIYIYVHLVYFVQ